MTHSFLPFISDTEFEEHIKFLLGKANEGLIKAQKKPDRNVIDPFFAFFSMTAFKLSPVEWSHNEQLRQAGKSFENALGDFHQRLLGSINGWESLRTGGQFDVICQSRKIIAEIKNKHNTVKASDQIKTYEALDDLVNKKSSRFKDFTGYYVTIIPKKPDRFDEPFTPSDRTKGKKAAAQDNVRHVDGATFYEIATGHKNVLKEIFEAIPKVVERLNSESLTDKYAHALTFFNKAFGQ